MDEEENIFDRMRRTMEDFMKDEEFRSEMEKIFEDFNRKMKKPLKEMGDTIAGFELLLSHRIESIKNDKFRNWVKKKVANREEITFDEFKKFLNIR